MTIDTLLKSVLCKIFLVHIFIPLLLSSCKQENSNVANSVFESKEELSASDADFDLSDIQAGGELIVLTLYGPTSYFEFRGENFGFQYKLADAFAQSIGVSVRVDVCRSTHEMLAKLQRGDGDLVAYQMPKLDSLDSHVTYCGTAPITRFIDSPSSPHQRWHGQFAHIHPNWPIPSTIGWHGTKANSSISACP